MAKYNIQKILTELFKDGSELNKDFVSNLKDNSYSIREVYRNFTDGQIYNGKTMSRNEVNVRLLTKLNQISTSDIEFISTNFTPSQMKSITSRARLNVMVEKKINAEIQRIAGGAKFVGLLQKQRKAILEKTNGMYGLQAKMLFPTEAEVSALTLKDKKRLLTEIKELKKQLKSKKSIIEYLKDYITQTYEYDKEETTDSDRAVGDYLVKKHYKVSEPIYFGERHMLWNFEKTPTNRKNKRFKMSAGKTNFTEQHEKIKQKVQNRTKGKNGK